MSASAWNEDRIARLKTLWTDGQSATQVARDLGNGITRNAVLGKVHRLRLSADRPTPAAQAVVRPASPPPRRDAGQAPLAEVATGGDPCAVTLLAVGRRQCRWPLGDPDAAGLNVCGRPVSRGVYCKPHGGMAYRPVRDTPETLERLARLN